jgi:uncharacterized membrane protein
MWMSRELKAVDKHLRHWRGQGLVDAELEARLRASSQELDRSGVGTVLRTALALLGGALVLAGLTLVVAENWMALSRGVKLAGWAVFLAAFVAASEHAARRFPDRPALGEAFALAAGGWVLAGIALVSQIYHLDSRPPNGIWLWVALVLPAAWLLPRRATAAVLFAALATGLALEIAEKDSVVHANTGEGPWLWLAIPLLAGIAVSFLPRPWPGLRAWLGAWTFAAGQVFLLVLGALQELDRSDLGRAGLVAAAGLLGAIALPRRVLPWDALTSRVLIAATLLPWSILGERYDKGAILDGIGIGAAWIAQFAVAILVIRAGARTGSRAWVNLGYLAVLAGVVVRYFDFFGAFLEGGAALALTGVMLLFIVFALEKARRRTLHAQVAS